MRDTLEFAADDYREMYESLTQVNIRDVLNHPYLRRKLETMWVQICDQGR